MKNWVWSKNQRAGSAKSSAHVRNQEVGTRYMLLQRITKKHLEFLFTHQHQFHAADATYCRNIAGCRSDFFWTGWKMLEVSAEILGGWQAKMPWILGTHPSRWNLCGKPPRQPLATGNWRPFALRKVRPNQRYHVFFLPIKSTKSRDVSWYVSRTLWNYPNVFSS